ncbi:hypothetical protein R6Q57_015632 [Mikania cordata]
MRICIKGSLMCLIQLLKPLKALQHIYLIQPTLSLPMLFWAIWINFWSLTSNPRQLTHEDLLCIDL